MIEIFGFFALFFFFGTAIGSFLNVIVDRIPRGESFLYNRSYCEHCRKNLAWYDLIPLISFLLLNGKCRYCHTPISALHPLIEAVTAVLFVLTASVLFSSPSLSYFSQFIAGVYYFFLISTLIIIFFIDLKFGIIPFKVVSLAILVTCCWYLLAPFLDYAGSNIQSTLLLNTFPNVILSALAVFLFFFLLFLVTKGRGLGFGDVVYVLLMGFVLGFPKIILGLYIAFLSGAFISLILVIVGKKKMKGGTIPFGPFLVFGTIVSLFWGQMLIEKILLYLLPK